MDRALIARAGAIARTAAAHASVSRTAVPAPSTAGAIALTVDRTTPLATSKMNLGPTITQRGLGAHVGSNTYGANLTLNGDAASVAQGMAYLGAFPWANFHTGYFGGANCWPDPTVALDPTQTFLSSANQWYVLDNMVSTYRQMGAKINLVLYKFPEWMCVADPSTMSGPPVAGTPSSWVNSAINPPYVGTGQGPYTGVVSLAAYSITKPPGYTGAMDGLSLAAYYAQQIATRYPDIHSFVVYNECMNASKGFQIYATNQSSPSQSDITTYMMPRYTALFNAVYSALKAVNPQIQVGGPYYTLGSSLNGSNQLGNNDTGALQTFFSGVTACDFIAIDGMSAASSSSSGSSTPPTQATQEAGLWNHYYATQDIINRVAAPYPAVAGKPVWWMESYVDTNNTHLNYNSSFYGSHALGYTYITHDYLGAAMTVMLMAETLGGAAMHFRWQAEASEEQYPKDARYGGQGNGEAWITQTSKTDGSPALPTLPGAFTQYGGQPTPAYWGAYFIQKYFGAGTPLYTTTTADTNVYLIASATRTLIVNLYSVPKVVSLAINGGSPAYYNIGPYGVVLVN